MAIVAGRECKLGCDVSRWQGDINFNVFNLDFVVYKATGGDDGLYTDKEFNDNANGFKTVEGPYHFASHAQFDAVQEANYFCDKILASDWAKMPSDKKLPPTLDWEPTVAVANSAAWCLRFLKQVEARTGMRPFIYTANWCRPTGTAAELAELKTYYFWLAAYVPETVVDNYACPPWGTDWTIWQNSATGSVRGIQGECDTDAFRSDRFNAILNTGSTPNTPTPPEEFVMASKEEVEAIINAAADRVIAAVKAANPDPNNIFLALDEKSGTIYLVVNDVKYPVPSPDQVNVLKAVGTKDNGPQGLFLSSIPTGSWDAR